MWTSNPRQYPELTPEETAEVLQTARREKGRQAYLEAYTKQVHGEKQWPDLDARTFRDFVVRRGKARAADRGWADFDIDADNRDILKILALYFVGDERFEKLKPGYSLGKGILLIGGTGVGKTQLMELCSVNPHASYTVHECQVIAEEFAAKDGGKPVLDHYSGHGRVSKTDYTFGQTITGRFFDDLGQEANARHFGNERNVMGEIIQNRYRLGNYFLTHFTSNHDMEQLGQFYGPRVEDRLREMCNIIQFAASAKSRRGSVANPIATTVVEK